MILVLSLFSYEQCTDPVVDWLLYYKVDFMKLTLKDLYADSKILFDINNRKLYYNGLDLIESVNCVYYRRFEDHIDLNLRKTYPTSQVLYELQNELEDLIQYFFYLFKDKKWFPNPTNTDIDKLTALNFAQECGLKIPKSIVANIKQEVLSFVEQTSSIIKPIRFSGYYNYGKSAYSIFTNSLSLEDLDELDTAHFFPTLIQEKIDKEFEIRLFYLDTQIYASAIITDDKDYDDVKRSFDSKSINWVPFQLPHKVELQLIDFMRRLNLNTGSIDMMKDKSGNFVFIEVNPVGQFIAPSKRCNFNLENKIAKWLIEHDKK